MIIDIKVGDVVQLKSGGPKMTVCSMNCQCQEIYSLYCRWFDFFQQVQSKDFIPESIIKINEDSLSVKNEQK